MISLASMRDWILLQGQVFKLKCVIGKGIKSAKSLFQNVDDAIELSRDYYDNGNISERLLRLNIGDIERGGTGDKTPNAAAAIMAAISGAAKSNPSLASSSSKLPREPLKLENSPPVEKIKLKKGMYI
jgi:hypothetical protein